MYRLLIFLLLSPFMLAAQQSLRGKVIDAQSGEPLPFVNLVVNDARTGTITDIDGKFQVEVPGRIELIRLSYVGYAPKVVYNPSGRYIEIKLERKTLSLQEVQVVAGENPAHRIIRQAVERRRDNDPENLNAFRYMAYNKFVVTLDTGEVKLDTIPYVRKRLKNGQDTIIYDSTAYEARNFSRERDLFLTESISRRSFRSPDLSNEQVLATRTSGFKNPVFVLLSAQLQSFSFYKDYIKILQVEYLNPISPGSTSRYFFTIEDTTFTDTDTVYIVSFKPRKGKNFSGMRGLLYINTSSYALQSVIAEPADSVENMQIAIRQLYKQASNGKWFPEQLHTDIRFTNLNGLGGIQPVGIGRSYLRDIEINPVLSRREIGMNGVEVDASAAEMPASFWAPFLFDTITARDQETYRYLDSIGKIAKLEQRTKWLLAVTTGKLAVGPVDFRLRDMFSANRYEGLRLGVSAATNDKVSRHFSVGGYVAWGFSDKQAKYGGNMDVHLDRRKNWILSFDHRNDLEASGGYQFYTGETSLFSSDNELLWNYFRQYFDRVQQNQLRLQFKNWRYLNGEIGLRTQYRTQTPWYLYRFIELQDVADVIAPSALNPNEFTVTEFRVQLRYAFRERYVKLTQRQYSVGTNYPVFWFNYTQGLNTLGGKLNYQRMEGRVEKSFTVRNAGKSTFNLSGGLLIGDNLPLFLHYFARGVGADNGLYAPNTFQTFDANDFVTRQFVQLHWNHSFGSLLLRTPKQAPIFSVENRLIFGSMRNPQQHQFTEPFFARIRGLEQGYYETGIKITRIRLLDQFWGVGVFYGYGPNAAPQVENRFAFKLVAEL